MKKILAIVGMVVSLYGKMAYGEFTVEGEEHVGKVTKVSYHLKKWNLVDNESAPIIDQEGYAQIYIEGLPKACGTHYPYNRVIISTKHPLYKSIVNAAELAKVLGKEVKVNYAKQCKVRSGSWDLLIFESL